VAVLIDYAHARREHGIPVWRRKCDVAALCREVAAECEAANPGRTVRCRGDAVAVGEWDPDRIGQALANLVTNALDYSPADSVVDVSWRGRDDEVEISVANAGTPIPPETLGRMFEPFRRGKRERAGGKGLGLGLFIARAIVVAHGGSIEARSDADQTAFTVRLPRKPPAA
jgi:phosphoserine phosphatase RsbU/P